MYLVVADLYENKVEVLVSNDKLKAVVEESKYHHCLEETSDHSWAKHLASNLNNQERSVEIPAQRQVVVKERGIIGKLFQCVDDTLDLLGWHSY